MNFTIIPQSWTPSLHGALRIMTGLTLLEHGTAKFFSFPLVDGLDKMPAAMLGVTGGLELVGGALVAVGLFTRPVAFLLAGFMAAAYFIAHAPGSFFPIVNHGEAAILYCFVFLFLAAAGPGRWALEGTYGQAGPAQAFKPKVA